LAEAQLAGDPFLVGVDYSWESLHGLNGVPTLQPGQANPVRLVCGDGLRLPFAAETFDVVIGHVSIPYMNTRAAFREIHRVLSPGGTFLLTFHSFHFVYQWLLQTIRTRYWRGLPYKAYIATNGVLNHFNLPQTQLWWRQSAFETVNTPRGIRLAAEMAGFTDVVSHPRPNRILFDATARKPSAGGPMMPPPEAIYPAT